jgi:cation diffusion facilitator CzcD-associated flavoprotein CzcO/acetyl esterase/lipase
MEKASEDRQAKANPDPDRFDAVVVGAGFAGLYALHKLTMAGLRVRCIEAGDGVGGTWFWNKYPGARCDVESLEYSYSFSDELQQDWVWSQKYAPQGEILRYINHVADRFDLRRHIGFNTRVRAAVFDEATERWTVETSDGESISVRYCVMASGNLSALRLPPIKGLDQFQGDWHHSSRWPSAGVDLSGKRVGVIGTGSTGIQIIPVVAASAEHLHVFQRSPNFCVPAQNLPLDAETDQRYKAVYAQKRQTARQSVYGLSNLANPTQSALELSPQERIERYEQRWQYGGNQAFLTAFTDLLTSQQSNDTCADFVRDKIRGIVDDPQTAAALCPTDHPIGARRLCVGSSYYETYNRPNVTLVDLRATPIECITAKGIRTSDREVELDVIIFATGFDAMTGALREIDIRGRAGLALKEKWADGPSTYLGLMVAGFPNFFVITGPGSPSVKSNMVFSIEQHVDWISDCIAHLEARKIAAIEPAIESETNWVAHVNEVANRTLYPLADSWYMGSNVPGKPRVFMPYVGGIPAYRKICDDVAAQGYRGFTLTQSGRAAVIAPLDPAIAAMFASLAAAGHPTRSAGTPDAARALTRASREAQGVGPAMYSVQALEIPTRSGAIPGRLYVPRGELVGLVVYLHGGGWVLGELDDFDPMVRSLAARSHCAVLLPQYRLAPEHPFPAGLEDGEDVIVWAADRIEPLAGARLPLIVAGDSAGANLAAVAIAGLTARVDIAGQVLIYPVTDSDMTRPSYQTYSQGMQLTRELMLWFFHHYAPPERWRDPRVSPLQATSLAGLPDTVVITAECDVLRDEGEAYAARLAAAGVAVVARRIGGLPHGFIRMHNLAEAADRALSVIAQDIEALCTSAQNRVSSRAEIVTPSAQERDAQ